MADAQGLPLSIFLIQLRELKAAGIQKIAVVINPGDESLLLDAAREMEDMLEFIPQTGPSGYGHAILCARDFVGDAPFLLSIADHLFVSDLPDRNCFEQVMEAARLHKASVSAVQSTRESEIHRFGTIGGERLENRKGLLRVREVIEKPTPTLAEQRLNVSGLRAGCYLSFFGIHVLQASIFQHLQALIEVSARPEKITLTDAVNLLLAEADYYALEMQGQRFDLEAPFGLLHGQVALALRSPARDKILGDLLRLVAES